MTSCPVCHKPLGDIVPHYPHEPGCPRTGDCTCPTPAVHPGCCRECAPHDGHTINLGPDPTFKVGEP